jgi:hypothetical protein
MDGKNTRPVRGVTSRDSGLGRVFVFLALCSASWWSVAIAGAMAKVPDLSGEHWAQARQIAELFGFKAEKGTFYIAARNWRGEIRTDTVYLQSMRAGENRETALLACRVFEKASEQRQSQRPLVSSAVQPKPSSKA